MCPFGTFQFFNGWVVVGIIWLFASVVIVVFLSVFESQSTINRTTRMMFEDLFGTGVRSKPVIGGRIVSVWGCHTAQHV